ncbi:MAG: dimethylsulfonioproprionate lyase family protein [Pseudomonadota bacterium]
MTVKPLLDAFRDYVTTREEVTTRKWFDSFDWNLTGRDVQPQQVPAVKELPEVVQHLGEQEKQLGKLFVDLREQLHWIQSYSADDFGQHMVDHYGYVEIIGTRGHYVSDSLAAGIVYFGRGINYPEHWHDSHALYYPLTGTGLWSQSGGEYLPKKSGEFVFHEPGEPHALKVPDLPLLAVWVWRGGDLAQKSDYL